MHTVTVQRIDVPSVGIGTWELPGEVCREAVRHALEIGYRHVDTAQLYGNEADVGRGLAESGVPREDVFLTTKLSRSNLAPGRVRPSVEESLRKLATDYVDLLLIHWPDRDVPAEATLDAMRELQDAGMVRHLGVSNFTADQLRRAAAAVPILCNQVEYHPLLSQQAVLAVADDLDLLVTAYSPVVHGKVLDEPVLRDIADAHGKTPAQVSIRWLVQQERVATIPRSSKAERRVENFDVFDFALSDDECRRIAGLARGVRIIDPPWAPDWDA